MLPILAVLFFLSGASALIYQVVWLRLLSLVFGVTVYAASTVLAAFMAGLAIGSAAAGRVADRLTSPLRWFGVAEILVGVTALLSPIALDLVRDAYVALAPAAAHNTAALTFARLVLSALVLLPPTMLMGATLPLVLRSSLVDAAGIGARVSLLYGINTAGAIAGALLAGFVLIGSIGMTGAFRLAATLNVAVGLTAMLLAKRGTATERGTATVSAVGPPETVAVPHSETVAVPLPGSLAVVVAVFAISGFASLALEVVWFRTLVLYYPATTYAFTAMLATVLAGIAAGSLIAAPLLRRIEPTLLHFGALHAATGIAAAAGFVALSRFYDPAAAATGVLRGAAITILPAAVVMGIAFPVGCRLWLRSTVDAGRRIGILYSANLSGAIAGSLAAGFLLLPRWGSARSLALLAGLSTATGVVVLLLAFRQRSRSAIVLAAAAVAAFAFIVDDLPDPFSAGLMRRHRDSGRIFMRDEGVQTTVSVHVRELGARLLYLDGLHQASDGRDVVMLHRQIGHLPVLLHPSPRRVLVIGLGGGATAGAVSLHSGVTVDVVELAPGVVRAAEWFTHINEDVLRKPNVRMHVDDGRNYMLLTRERYDVITADIIQPTHAGAGLLYSQEYFRTARRVLTDDGVMVQWVGPRSDTYYRLIARTFQSVFPETTVWVNGSLLVGSVRPQPVDRTALARRFADGQLQAALAAAGFPNVETLLAHYTAGPEELRAFLGSGPVLTDDKPMLEYFLSLGDSSRAADLTRLRGKVR
jgi:spermidine synthase